MIELATESLIPLRQVPELLPRRPNGKKVHISAVYRWTTHGIRGGVLESIPIGGTTYTSTEALQRFAELLAANRSDQATPASRMTVSPSTSSSPIHRMPKQRQAQARRAA